MQREVTDWADFVDENSNISMKSVDFGELPLEKLDKSNSRSRDPELDYSREGLNLLVSNALKFSERTNSNCSTSRKRLRKECVGPRDFSRFMSKRPKTALPSNETPPGLLPPHPTPQAGPPIPSDVSPTIGLRSLRPQLNFAGILKATKEKKEEDHTKLQGINKGSTEINNASSPSNPNRAQFGSSWAQRLFCTRRVNKNDQQVRSVKDKAQPSDLNLPKGAKNQVFKPPVRRKLKPKSVKKSLKPNAKGSKKTAVPKENLKIEDKLPKHRPNKTRRKNRSLLKVDTSVIKHPKAAPFNQSSKKKKKKKKVIPSLSTCKSPRAEQTSYDSSPTNPKSKKAAMDIDECKPPPGKCQVMWQMPKKAGVIITKNVGSPEFLMWGTPKTPLIQNILTGFDKAETTTRIPKCCVESESVDVLKKEVSAPPPKKLTKEPKVSCPPKKLAGATASQEIAMVTSITPDPSPHTTSARSPLPLVVKTHGSGRRSTKVVVAPNSNALGQVIIMTDTQIKNRKKQVDFGKRTVGYANYLKKVPKDKRSSNHPQTPDVMERISKRRFTGKMHNWRRKLHQWDDPESQESAGSVPPLPDEVPEPLTLPAGGTKDLDTKNFRKKNTTVYDCDLPKKMEKE